MQTLPSLHATIAPPTHKPPWHKSLPVQALPSLQAPLVRVWTQPPSTVQPSPVHGRPSSHAAGLPAVQLTPTHFSPSVHGLPSSQLAVLAVWMQPDLGPQLSSVHAKPSSQLVVPLAVHLPSWHASPLVHASPSLQAALTGVAVQPLAGSQASAVQGLLSSQLTALPPVHTPLLHASPLVHVLPSSQVAVPPGLWTQPSLPSQLSKLHGSLSLQSTAAPPTHTPLLHTSPWVQAVPSLQSLPLAVWLQPLKGAQPSSVQGLVSSQLGVPLPVQLPPLHTSVVVQALPSLHAA